MLTTLIILNPAAGGKLAKQTLPALQSYLSEKQVDFAIYTTQKACDLEGIREALQKYPSRYISIVGGDGTLHEVLNSSPEVFKRVWHIIPCGRANNFARSFYGALLEPSFFFDRITDPLPFQIDTVKMNDLLFLGGIGLGLGARVHHTMKNVFFRNLSGKIAYSLVILLNLIKPKILRFQISEPANNLLDMPQKKIIAIEILKATHVGMGYQVFDEIKLNNRLMRCAFFTKSRMIPRLQIFRKLDDGRYNKHPEALHFKDLNVFRFTTDVPQIFHADGEIYCDQEFNFSIYSTPLSILI